MIWAAVAVGAFVGAASSMLSNNEQARANSKMAKWRREQGRINAKNTWLAAQRHAAMIDSFGRYQSAMEWMAGEHEANMIMAKTDYNMQLSASMSEYNAQLYEQESQDIWDQLGLDIYWLRMGRAAERGDIATSYAHAGVELNSMDTPEQTLMDSKTMEELEVGILNRNAEVKAGKALDAAAMSRWEGRVLRQQMAMEATLESQTSLLNAFSRASSIAIQSYMDASMTRFNGANQADSLLYDAYYDASTYDLQADYHRNPWRIFEGAWGGSGGLLTSALSR